MFDGLKEVMMQRAMSANGVEGAQPQKKMPSGGFGGMMSGAFGGKQMPSNPLGVAGAMNGMFTPPPTQATNTAPRWQRWETAQQMADGYRNNWNPNPVLTSLMK